MTSRGNGYCAMAILAVGQTPGRYFNAPEAKEKE